MVTANPPVADDRLEEVLAEYLADESAGQRPNRQHFVANHPDLASDLEAFFRRRDWMGRLLGQSDGRRRATESEPPQTESFAGRTPRSGLGLDAPARLGRFGEYELLEEVARGGMGVIYRARHARLNRIVALKMILANRLACAEHIDRFYLEAKAAAQLDHPGIVPIFEAGRVDDQHYYSMAYVEGRSLQAVLAEVGVVDPQAAAEIVRRVAEAMAYAHARGILHRDLKPANILLAETQRSDAVALALPGGSVYCEPRVADFGLAKEAGSAEELTGTGQILGTPGYMPPEQARGEARGTDTRSDVYSLGAVLYCLVTGRPPFRAADAIQTLKQVVEDEAVPPRRLNSAVPRDLETICLKCLEKNPGRRYASAQELADDLRRFQSGQPITARPVGSVERAQKWIRRRPAAAALAVAGLIVLMACVGLAVSQQYQADLQRGLYFRSVNGAHQAWRDNEFVEARRLLDQCPKQLRGWEWDYVDRLCHLGFVSTATPVAAFEGRRNPMTPGGTKVFVLEAASGQELTNLKDVKPDTFGVRFTPDGQHLETASGDGEICLWDLKTSKMIGTEMRPGDFPPRIVYSPDGRYVACCTNATFFGNRVPNNREFSHFGDRVPVSRESSDNRMRDLRAMLLGIYASTNDRKVADGRDGTTIDADSRAAIAAKAQERKLNELAEMVVREHKDKVNFGAVDAGRQRLATVGNDGTIKLWDVAQCRYILDCDGHRGPVYDIAFSPDGRRVASAGNDRIVRIWDVLTGRLILTLGGPNGHLRAVNGVAFHPSGGQLATVGGDLATKIWNVGSGSEADILRGHPGPATSIAFHPDGKTFASAGKDGVIKLWQRESRTVVREIQAHTELISALAFSPDGQELASASHDRTVKVWKPATGDSTRVRTLMGHQGKVYGVSFSPDGQLLASAGHDGKCLIWKLSNDQLQEKIDRPKGPVCCVAFARQGRLLAMGGSDLAVRRLERGSEALVPSGELEIVSVAVSPDGARVAAGSRDGKLLICRAASGSVISTIAAHHGELTSVTFSPAGDRVATTSWDGSIKVWDPDSPEQETLALKGQGGRAYCVAFSPDGRYLAAANHDGTITLWGR